MKGGGGAIYRRKRRGKVLGEGRVVMKGLGCWWEVRVHLFCRSTVVVAVWWCAKIYISGKILNEKVAQRITSDKHFFLVLQ